MLVDRPRADAAATRQRDPGLAEARHQRPQHQDRRAHGLDQLVRRLERVDVGAVERDRGAILFGAHAHQAQQLERGAHVLQVGHVIQRDGIGREQACAQDRQRGILGARNADFAPQRTVALDLEFVHVVSVLAGLAPGVIVRGPRMRRGAAWPAYLPSPACHSAGVSVFIDSAWISARMRSPSAA
ncbi:hypothetical protein D9M68_728520 [compost metagenome]